MEPYSILNNVIFLDIETTGIDPEKDTIIEIGAVKIKNNDVTRFSSLVNPNRSVPLNILDLCKDMTQDELDKAPQLDEVMKELRIFIEDMPIICHNAAFEESFLNIDNEFLDSLELVAILFPELQEFNLQYLINRFLKGEIEEKHRGLSDSEDTIKVLNMVISTFYIESGFTLPMTIAELEQWQWYRFLSNINMDNVKYFIDNANISITKELKQKAYPVFALKDYEKLFDHKEIWTRTGRGYKLRPQQREASKFIREGLQNSKFTIMEAPTGLGKSLAYLLPASIYSYLNNEKVIISTNTKSLQSQLVDKDIPNLLESLNVKDDVSYDLIKGKSNYLCFDRFEDIEYPKDINTLLGYIYLKRLITEKGLGDIEDINYGIKEKLKLNSIIEQCYCDGELCDIESCSYRERCYYASKVEALRESKLVVVNHSLLLKWPYQNVAPLENIIIDEAHNLTQEAYDAFESSLISYEFEKFLKEIYNSKEKTGYLYYLSLRAKDKNLPLREIEADIDQCITQIYNVKTAFENYINHSGISKEYNIKEHLKNGNPNTEHIVKALTFLKEDVSSLNLYLDKCASIFKEIKALEKDKRLKVLIEKVEVIGNYIRLIEDIIVQNKEDYCFYFEVDKNLNWWRICSIPLDVSGDFYDKILNGAKSCLFISATLSTDNGYNNLKNSLGINIAKSQNKEIVEVPPIDPVFDYKGKSAVYAIENIDPNDIGSFAEEMKNFVLKLIDNIEGNIIILFTSRKRLEAFKNDSLDSFSSLGIRLVEGKKDIVKLKSRNNRYILLGSKGYFEGIDIPGDSMTTVILDKVPNINSKEPFYKSLVENGIEKGKNYWQAYANINFPIVSIDLKQIYGRIIRTEYDYGALFIMSKFDSTNSTVRKLEKQLHGVPIIRNDENEIFKDLKRRTQRWKQINLYKIMKEVKETIKNELKKCKNSSKLDDPIKVEDFVNVFFKDEYEKRNLQYDVHISLIHGVHIFIADQEINLGKSKKDIMAYFEDILLR